MITGIPYLGDNNTANKHMIIDKCIDKEEEISMYSLIELVQRNEKSIVVIIDNQFLTWLDDIMFDYRHKECVLPYYDYELAESDIKVNLKRKADNHLEYGNDNNILVRYNFSLIYLQINIGDTLVIYNINTREKIRYTIKCWADDKCEFSLARLYELYKQYCFNDIKTFYSGHEGGYTLINEQYAGFTNREKNLRANMGLKTWKIRPIKIEYRDVRVYEYFDYLNRIKSSYDGQLSSKLFKYRRLAFESYLFCCLQDKKTPIDRTQDWDMLGKSKYYIKITDGTVPFFIKSEWLIDNHLISSVTWRR